MITWQERQAKLLRNEIELALAPLSDTGGFFNLVKEPLAKRVLENKTAQDRPWSLLSLIVCEAISGHYEQALPAAAAIQLFTAAADVFDDIEDADSSESLSSRHGLAVATNVATALLFLAEKAVMRLSERGVGKGTKIHIIKAINSYYLTACAGQHLDIVMSQNTSVSEAEYLRMIEMKTASQIECACHVGALLGNADQELIEIVSSFGKNLGMAAQIANDIRGITSGVDVAKRKIALPMIYAWGETKKGVKKRLNRTNGEQAEAFPQVEQMKELLFKTGSIQIATIKMETFKQTAFDKLFEAQKAGVDIGHLKLMLE